MRLKTKIKEIIYKAEVFSQNSGVSVMEVLYSYAIEMGNTDKEVKKILVHMTSLLKRGQKRWNVYKKYIDNDILNFLKIAETKNLPAGTIFEEYVPIKQLAESYIAGIRKKLISPLIFTLILIFAMGISVSKFKFISNIGIIHFSGTADFILDYFYHLNFAILAIMVILFIIIPDKLPLLKGIFLKLYSMLGLSMILMMNKLGYSSSEIINPLITQFNIKLKKQPKRNIDGLMQILKESKFVTPLESADLKISLNHADLNVAIEAILEQRRKSADELNEEVGGIIKNITILMMASPVIMTVIILLNLIIATASKV